MTKFLKNVDVTGYVSQTSVTSSLVKTDSSGKLVAAVAGTDYATPGALASADKMVTIGRNATGATLYQGTIVYISGSTGNRPNFVKAQANGESTSAGTFGVVLADIPNNSDGNVVTIGAIDNLDTRADATNPFTSDTLVDGDTIYLSPTTAGYVTRVKPSAPNHIVYVGKVVRTSPTNGTIVYRIQNGYELDEIHDVAISSLANNHTLVWESATSLWKNKTIAAALGYTPADDAAVVKLTGDQTVAGVKTFTSVVNAPTLSLNGGVLAGNNIVSMRSNPTGGQFRIEKSDGSLSAYPFYIGSDGTALAYYYNAAGALKVLLHTNDTSYFGNSLSVGYTTYASTSYMLDVNGTARFTGALSGTSATFSGTVVVASPFTIKDTNPYIQWKNASDTRLGYIQHATNLVMAADSGNIVLNTASGSFTLASGGAATFNSSVAATNITLGSGTIGSIPSWMKVITTDATQSGIGAIFNNKALYLYNNGSAIKLDAYDYATSTGLNVQIGGNGGKIIASNGQVQFTTYTSATSYTGTAAGYLAFDSSGNIITVAGVAASVTSGFSVTSQGAANNTPSTPSVNIGVYAGVYAFIDLATQNTNGSWIDFSKGDGGDFAGRIRYYNTDDHFGFHTNGGEEKVTISSTGVLAVNGNNVWHAGNLTNLNQLTNGPGYITSSATITGAAARISSRDNRTIAPNSDTAAELRFGFTSWNNNNTSPWADYIHLRSYSDSSGGADNLIMFRKDAIGMRIWQQTWGSATAYSSYVDVLHSGNYNSYAVPLTGGTMSGILAFSNTTGNKIDFYHTTTGSGDRYGVQVQNSELRIHSGAGGDAAGGITFGKSTTTTFTEAMRVRNDGLIAIVNNLVVGSQQGFDNPGGWNKNILIDGTYHGRFRIKASNYTYGNIDVALWADSSVSPSHGINGSNAVFAFNGSITSLTVGGQTVIHTGNYSSYVAQIISPNGGTVVAADAAMPSAGHSFIHTLALGPSGNDGHILGMTWSGTTTSYGAQIWVDTDPNNRMAFRSRSGAGVWTGWNEVIHSSNYSSYALPLTGGTISGNLLLNTSAGTSPYFWLTTDQAAHYIKANNYWIDFVGNGNEMFRWYNTTTAGYAMTIDGSNNLYVRGNVYVSGNGNSTGTQVVYNSGTWGINISGTASYASGISTDFLGTGSTNISSGYSRVIRNENGSGGNMNYAPVLHLAASDTMWQIQGAYGGSTGLQWRSGYAGTWSTPWWTIVHSGNQPYAYNLNQYVNTNSDVQFGNGGSDAGIRINQAGTGYGRIRFYQDGSNYATIHAFGTTSGYSPSIGCINIDATNGTTIGPWNAPHLKVTSSGLTIGSTSSSNIWMTDSDETTRRIHCNSNRIGFLNSSDGWGSWCDNDGGWQSAASISAGGAIYSSNWLYSNGNAGWYNNTYGQGLRQAKANVTYGNVIVHGENYNGWSGYNTNNNYITCFMQNSSGTHGWYQENGAGWTAFYNYGYACWGLGTDATDPSYSLHITKYGGSNTGWIIWSDRRIKENIKTIDNALDKVLALRGVYYNKIDDPNKERQVGYIAQEVMEVVPELVVYSEELDIYNMNYAPMVSMLTEAVKEQQSQIETLKQQVQTLLTHINNGI